MSGLSKSSKNVVLSFNVDGTTVSYESAGLSEITVKVSPKTIDTDDLSKIFKLQGTINIAHEEYNWGNTTVHYTYF